MVATENKRELVYDCRRTKGVLVNTKPLKLPLIDRVAATAVCGSSSGSE